LWRVSRILNSPPFSDEILNLDTVQVNFILKMYAKDHPDEFKIIDPAIARGETKEHVFLDWSNKLSGDAKKEFDRSPIAYLIKHFDWKND
jgi:hypothetical protein